MTTRVDSSFVEPATRVYDLKDAIQVGHSTGGGEVTRYIGRHGTKRVAKAVMIGAVPPLMLKTDSNPGGLPIEVQPSRGKLFCFARRRWYLNRNRKIRML